MKREIGFRVFNELTGHMEEVKTICGGYVWDGAIDPVYDSAEKMIDTAYDVDSKLHHLMEFTGLRDSKGVKIYEGDIVHWPGWDGKTYQVCYDRWGIPALAGIKTYEGGDFKEFEMNYNATPKKCVVLGNIYQNPGLLEVKP